MDFLTFFENYAHYIFAFFLFTGFAFSFGFFLGYLFDFSIFRFVFHIRCFRKPDLEELEEIS